MTDVVAKAVTVMGMDAASYHAEAQRVVADNEKIAASGNDVVASTEKISRANQTTADGFAKLESRYDKVIALEQRRAAAITQATRYLDEGTVTQDRFTAQIARVNAYYDQQIAKTKELAANQNVATRATAGWSEALGVARTALAAFGIAIGAQQIIKFGVDSLQAAGGLGEMAQQLGLSTEALQTYQYAATQAGLKQGDLETGFSRLTRTIGEAAQGNSQAVKTFNDLGVGVLNAGGKIRSTDAIALDLANALAKIPDPAARAAAEVDLFGKSGQKLDTIFASGAGAIEEFRRQAEAAGAVLDDAAIAKADEAADKLEALDFRFHKLGQTLAVEAAPGLSKFIDKIDELLAKGPSVNDWLDVLTYSPFFSLMNKLTGTGSGNTSLSDLFQSPPAAPPPTATRDFGDPRRFPSDVITTNPGDAAAAKKTQDVIDKLKLQYDQLGRTAEQQKVYNALTQAGVDINSAAGQQIAELVGKIDEETKRLAVLADMRKKDADVAAQMDKDRIDAIHRGQALDDAQRTQWVKSQQDQKDQITILQTQLNLIGATNEQRAIEMAHVQALISLHKQEGDALTANEAAYVANAEQIALLNLRLDEQTKKQQDQAKFFEETWKNAIEGIQGAFSDFFTNVFTEGVSSFTDLANQVADIWKKTASQLISKIVIDEISSNLGGSGSSALGSSGGDFFQSFLGIGGATGNTGVDYGTGIGGGNDTSGGRTGPGGTLTGGTGASYSYASAGISAAAALLPVGAAYASGQSVNTAQLGSAAGGLVGGAIGSIWGPVAGMAGSMIGSVAGGLLGGLFGGSGPPKQKSITDISVDEYGQYTLGGTYTRHDATTASSRSPSTQAVNTLNDILTTLGATVSARPEGSINDQLLYYGRTPRYMSQVGGVVNQFGSDAQGATDAMQDFIVRSLQAAISEGRVSGISATAQKAITASTDYESFQRNVDFANFYDQLGKAPETVTEASKAIAAIELQFRSMRDIAESLGIALEPIDQGLLDAKAAYAAGFDKTISDAILSITDPLTLALNNQADLAQQRLAEAKDAGANIVEVERLNALEREKILEQSNQGLRNFFDDLTFGSLSNGSPGSNLEGARASFEAAAASGDRAGIETYGRALLGASQAFNASGQGYTDDLTRVLGVVSGYITANDNQPVVNAVNDVGALIQASNNLLAQMNQRLADQDERIRSLTEQLQALAA